MIKISPDPDCAPSPKAIADLERLARNYRIDAKFIDSLKTSKKDARANIRFFKIIMYACGLMMAIGATIFLYAVIRIFNGGSLFWICLIGIGLFILHRFFFVFSNMNKAIRETEAVAQRHNLI